MAFLSSLKSLAPCPFCRRRKQQHSGGRSQSQEISQKEDHQHEPLKILPPLKLVLFPLVEPHHQFSLADQGWTTITYGTADKLYTTSQAMFHASESFFDLPETQKQAFKTQHGTEEGWSHVVGEKEFITLRSLEGTPESLRNAASAFWAEAGRLLNELLGRVAESLGLPAEMLTVYSEPCGALGHDRTATMLRLFRYEGFEGQQCKTVAEGMLRALNLVPFSLPESNYVLSYSLYIVSDPQFFLLAHRDLGLLSLVIGDTPGLEVWDRHARSWFPIERSYDSPAGSVLVGRQLECLSNGRYRAGGHLVRSYPSAKTRGPTALPDIPRKRHRYSIVFVLRAHSPIPIDTDNLTTSITGQFSHPLKDITAVRPKRHFLFFGPYFLGMLSYSPRS
jgi:isopenicillin N synthase-like dioxygenase